MRILQLLVKRQRHDVTANILWNVDVMTNDHGFWSLNSPYQFIQSLSFWWRKFCWDSVVIIQYWIRNIITTINTNWYQIRLMFQNISFCIWSDWFLNVYDHCTVFQLALLSLLLRCLQHPIVQLINDALFFIIVNLSLSKWVWSITQIIEMILSVLI